jgi:putative restriction endonuclease
VFAYANTFPCSLAWEAFGEANGAASLAEVRTRIARYQQLRFDDRNDFIIGSCILAQPFFLDDGDWILVPRSWSRNIVSFKTYTTGRDRRLTSSKVTWNQMGQARVFRNLDTASQY